MTDLFLAAEDRLLLGMSTAVRGPKQNGYYALWLFVRQCDGELLRGALSPDASERRLALLERRLSSLSLPAPLRRGMSGALRELHSGPETDVAHALDQLIAPASDALGPTAADAMAKASRKARVVSIENGNPQ